MDQIKERAAKKAAQAAAGGISDPIMKSPEKAAPPAEISFQDQLKAKLKKRAESPSSQVLLEPKEISPQTESFQDQLKNKLKKRTEGIMKLISWVYCNRYSLLEKERRNPRACFLESIRYLVLRLKSAKKHR